MTVVSATPCRISLVPVRVTLWSFPAHTPSTAFYGGYWTGILLPHCDAWFGDRRPTCGALSPPRLA